MKIFFASLFFFNLVLVYGQDVELLDYNWTIEKIVTEDETLIADPEESAFDILSFGDYPQEDNQIYFLFASCDGLFIFTSSEMSFNLLRWGCTFNVEDTEIAQFFYDVFVVEESEFEWDDGELFSSFTYAFREEEDKIYLDITNNEGSVATFWTSTLSTPSFEETAFSFYPNPVKDRLHLESPQEEIQKIEIFDINGKKVLQSNFSNQAYIEVGHLARGVYMLKVDTKNGSATKKLVKE